jgi:hypothetical protein
MLHGLQISSSSLIEVWTLLFIINTVMVMIGRLEIEGIICGLFSMMGLHYAG